MALWRDMQEYQHARHTLHEYRLKNQANVCGMWNFELCVAAVQRQHLYPLTRTTILPRQNATRNIYLTGDSLAHLAVRRNLMTDLDVPFC